MKGNNMRREQKIPQGSCPARNRLEADRYPEARRRLIQDMRTRNGGDLMSRIVSRDNMVQAYKHVRKNGGAAGVDGMTLDGMKIYLSEHYETLIRSISDGSYRPLPVRRVEIPKPDGGVRLLGVPTVIDRMVQQAVAQVLMPIFERTFSDSSYGFRPGRSAKMAIQKARDLYNSGYRHVVDLDLSKYFDTINHELLLNMIREEVQDKAVVQLIKHFLKSGVMVNGILSATDTGSPQGGPLSPLLSNIYLTKFDREMEKRGHKFVRYADDVNVYVRSRRSAQRVMASCKQYLETKLKLKVNETKSKAGSPLKLKFLGFSLRSTTAGQASIRIHEKSIDRFKIKIRELLKRNQGRSIKTVLDRLNLYTRGWLNYYSIADAKKFIQRMNELIGRKIRAYIWKQWKRIKCRSVNLQSYGVPRSKAWEWANTRQGIWRIAGAWIMTTTITNKQLERLGYDDILKRYITLHSNC